ncbi:hypothetical protein OQJ13_09810 [Legionella sp. PATHC035]|uniref:hypothetical protein n=1 Tax=Legionella sp. PATHC035 TaxID=2992040 RepID=UPI0022430913|nr:hypothetical protein [Legionella sp. PATHC035]MCW8409268.1 hypothetical protein [Legionella sp. PATHC035]
MINIKKRIAKINRHSLGILLSLSSASLGMLRDVLLVFIFGFSTLNDILQIYLSLYFVICFFSDPLRLTYLNLIAVRPFKQLICLLLSVVFVFIMFFVGFMMVIKPNLNPYYMFLAALGGFLNLFVSLLVFHKQRFGAYLSPLLVSVAPSFLMIPAVITLAFLPTHFFVLCFLFTFVLIHTIQLFLLTFIRIPNYAPGKMPLCLEDLWFLLRHCISVLGEQLFQIVGRLIFLQLGQGFLTLTSLFMKCLITFRFVFVDSYIGIKISSWSPGSAKDRFLELIDNKHLNFILILALLSICSIDTLNFYFVGLQFLLISIVSCYFSSLHRIVYFKINRSIHNARLVTFTGLVDLFSALFVLFCLKLHVQNHSMLFVYFWYILRLFIEISILRLYFNKFQMNLGKESSAAP